MVVFIVIIAVTFFIMCTLPNDNAGHIDGMFGDGALTGWGIAPNRFAVQPDLLCLGTVKMVVSGSLKVVMLKSNQVKMGFTGLNKRTINLLRLIIIFGMKWRVKEG